MDKRDIEFVARQMCKHMGLDPDKQVQHGDTQSETNAERAASGGWSSDMAFVSEQWVLFRRQAEEALAARAALADLDRRGE